MCARTFGLGYFECCVSTDDATLAVLTEKEFFCDQGSYACVLLPLLKAFFGDDCNDVANGCGNGDSV